MGTRRSDLILGAALLGVAGFFGMGALRMRYFTAIGPGPGFFPRWLALLLGLLGLAILLRAWLGRSHITHLPKSVRSGLFDRLTGSSAKDLSGVRYRIMIQDEVPGTLVDVLTDDGKPPATDSDRRNAARMIDVLRDALR